MHLTRVAVPRIPRYAAATAVWLGAEYGWQLGGESPLHNLMAVKC
jgi:hypothetical protein